MPDNAQPPSPRPASPFGKVPWGLAALPRNFSVYTIMPENREVNATTTTNVDNDNGHTVGNPTGAEVNRPTG